MEFPRKFPRSPRKFPRVPGNFRWYRGFLGILETVDSPRNYSKALKTMSLRDELKFLRIYSSLLMISSAPQIPTVPVDLWKHEVI
jgi:hypothetical protein